MGHVHNLLMMNYGRHAMLFWAYLFIFLGQPDLYDFVSPTPSYRQRTEKPITEAPLINRTLRVGQQRPLIWLVSIHPRVERTNKSPNLSSIAIDTFPPMVSYSFSRRRLSSVIHVFYWIMAPVSITPILRYEQFGGFGTVKYLSLGGRALVI